VAPKLIRLAEILFKSKDPIVSDRRPAPEFKAASLGASHLLNDMESDFREFLAMFKFLEVTEECAQVGSIVSMKSKILASHLSDQTIEDKNDSKLLSKIVKGLEEYKEHWWLKKVYNEEH
jgi:hypothetical protein